MATIKTRILIISDTHSQQHPTPPLPRPDVLIHAGDLTMWGAPDEHLAALELLESLDAPLKLVIAGNHDVSLDLVWWRTHAHHQIDPSESFPTTMLDLWTSERARAAGIMYLHEGLHSLRLPNGAALNVYATPYTPVFGDGAFAYERGEDRFNPAPESPTGQTNADIARFKAGTTSGDAEADDSSSEEEPTYIGTQTSVVPSWPAVDVLVSHGPAQGIGDNVGQRGRYEQRVGCEALARAVRRARPRVHCFGHIHEGWGAGVVGWEEEDGYVEGIGWRRGQEIEDGVAKVDVSSSGRELRFGSETLMVNAAVLDVRYKPTQRPFWVEVDLPVAKEG